MKEKLLAFISSKLLNGTLIGDLQADEDLLSSGLVDSMGMMRLIAYIEEETGIQVPPEDMILENFMNVESIEKYLQSRS